VNRIVTAKQVDEAAEIHQAASNYVREIKELIEAEVFTRDEVVNADQSGFLKELHSGRTLETVGTKVVEGTAQSTDAGTHSYTIMPGITASGRLMSPLLICLQEKSGKFPEFKPIFQVRLVISEARDVSTVLF
jgi:hypothetical protein